MPGSDLLCVTSNMYLSSEEITKTSSVMIDLYSNDPVKRDFEKRQFCFEHIFKPDRTKNNTEIVFDVTCKTVLENVLAGFNGCIMAYGQTGTGKTYTIVHELIPKSFEWIFQNKPKGKNKYSDMQVYFSCLQIYNEKLSDLLDPNNNKIELREKRGVFKVNMIKEKLIYDCEEAKKLISTCEMNRNIGSTSLNPYSSRSHAVYMVKLVHPASKIVSNLFFIDLAGSERLKVFNIIK